MMSVEEITHGKLSVMVYVSSMMRGSNENIKEIIGIVSNSDYLIFSSNPHYTKSLLGLRYFLFLTCITN